MLPTVPAKTLLTRCKAPGSWFGIDYNMNLYRGCCHGCLYCDSRSTLLRHRGFRPGTGQGKRPAAAAGRAAPQGAHRGGGYRFHERPLQPL